MVRRMVEFPCRANEALLVGAIWVNRPHGAFVTAPKTGPPTGLLSAPCTTPDNKSQQGALRQMREGLSHVPGVVPMAPRVQEALFCSGGKLSSTRSAGSRAQRIPFSAT